MFVIAGVLLGIVLGVFAARRHGGKLADQVQYAAGFGICFGLVGMIVTIALTRLA